MANCAICGKPVSTGVVVHPECLPRWISVKERLPKKEGEYLATLVGNVVSVAFFSKINGWSATIVPPNFSFIKFVDLYVTHWMPLPEPPKEENNADKNNT